VGFGALSSFIRKKALGEIVSAIAGRHAVFYPGWNHIVQLNAPGVISRYPDGFRLFVSWSNWEKAVHMNDS
jgi:hypothetical protein